jgi:hypothetical protein
MEEEVVVPLASTSELVPKTIMPTASLRFVERDGKRILQQAWQTGYEFEWRDVPLETEAE